jgi:hypothetical protein
MTGLFMSEWPVLLRAINLDLRVEEEGGREALEILERLKETANRRLQVLKLENLKPSAVFREALNGPISGFGGLQDLCIIWGVEWPAWLYERLFDLELKLVTELAKVHDSLQHVEMLHSCPPFIRGQDGKYLGSSRGRTRPPSSSTV